MQKFQLLLKNEKVKQYKLFGLLIVLINILFFIISAITTEDGEVRIIYLIGSAIIAVTFLYFFYIRKEDKNINAEAITILLIIIMFLVVRYWWLSALVGLLGVLYLISLRKMIVEVDSSFVVYPSVPKRVTQWAELNNVILKDGLLTIDFKNNKLAQVMVIADGNIGTPDEKEFNEFCKEQIKKSRNDKIVNNNNDLNDAVSNLNVID